MIEVDIRTFRYEGEPASVLSDVKFAVRPGETVLLAGASGSGKSTLGLLLSGLIPHAVHGELEGDVRIGGIGISDRSPAQWATRVGMVFQDPDSQLVAFTVEEEIVFGLENLGLPPEQMEERLAEALAAVGLGSMRKQLTGRLSGGQKQRLAIASVLAMRPSVLILDEPTSHLDPAGRADIFAWIRRLARSGRYTIVLIEHHLDECASLVDRIIVLGAGGSVRCEGSPQTVFGDAADLVAAEGIALPAPARICRELGLQGAVPLTVEDAAQQLLAELDAAARTRASGTAAERLSVAYRVLEASLAAETGVEPGAAGVVRPTASALDGLALGATGSDVASDSSPPMLRPAAVVLRAVRLGATAAGDALQPFELTVPAGDCLAIVGENGAGKTTFAMHLVRMLRVRRRVLYLSGRDAAGLSARELLCEAGFVCQNPEHQFVTGRVLDELTAGKSEEAEVDLRRAEAHTVSLLQRFRLETAAERSPYTLSQGEKRRLSVATMLTSERRLLVLDEPTFGQDGQAVREIMELLKQLQREGVTIIFITHDLSLVADYADHVALLKQGQAIYHGTPEGLFKCPELLDVGGLRLPVAAELAVRLSLHYPQLHGIASYAELLCECRLLMGNSPARRPGV